MDKALKDEFSMTKQSKILWLSILAIFLGLSVFVYFTLYDSIEHIVHGQSLNSITNICQLNEETVSRAIINRRTLVELISKRLSQRNLETVDEALSELEDFGKYYNFHSIGVMDENRMLYLTNGKVLDVGGEPNYEAAWDDEFHISPSHTVSDGGVYAINTLSFPIYDDQQIKYILIANYSSVNLTDRMNIDMMKGKGHNFIVNSMGKLVIYPKLYDADDEDGLMRYVNNTNEILPNESGNTSFKYKGEKYYVHFERMSINKWYLMTCAKESDVFAEADKIMNRVFFGMCLLWGMVILAMILTGISMYRSRSALRKNVFYDDLLEIGNGNFLKVLYDKLEYEEKNEMALIMFDIDKFKEFNYIYGEVCGDDLLKYIVRIFHEQLPDDYLFRSVSDHFALLLRCTNRQECIQKLTKVTDRFAADINAGTIQPFDISCGIRKIHARDSFRQVVSEALIAKSTIKGVHLQQYAFYDESILHKRMNYMELESDFSRALKANEFKVYYQPKYEITTGKIIGAEALVRWIKPSGSMVFPGEFIPCFEASKQIILLDEFMLREVCTQMKKMTADGIDIKPVSVNLSRVHLRNKGILSKIRRIIRASGVEPSVLAFEITESALYEDSIPLKNIVDYLHGLGCRVDMDDYGVGVSGPRALAANKFDTIKLDKSFIDGIGDERMEVVIKSIIALTKKLGMDIIAEGVEEKEQAEHLVKWGCTKAQGFYYSVPVSEEEYRALLKKEQEIE